ncbi:MAG: nuclear transport factor 2 family protein [Bacteroidales bacterium]
MKNYFTTILLSMLVSGAITSVEGQSLTDAQKAQIEKEIDSAFTLSVKAAETLDYDKIALGVDDRHQAGFITNGRYFADFNSLLQTAKDNATPGLRQQISFQQKKITVLSNSIALLTATGESKLNTSTGTVYISFFWTFVYEKIKGDWKVIQSHQSGNR